MRLINFFIKKSECKKPPLSDKHENLSNGVGLGAGHSNDPVGTKRRRIGGVERSGHALHGRKGFRGLFDPAALQHDSRPAHSQRAPGQIRGRPARHLRSRGRPVRLDQPHFARQGQFLGTRGSPLWRPARARPRTGRVRHAGPGQHPAADGVGCGGARVHRGGHPPSPRTTTRARKITTP